MRKLVFCVAILGAAWIVDILVFKGRLSEGVWTEAKVRGQDFYYQVNHWWRRHSW